LLGSGYQHQGADGRARFEPRVGIGRRIEAEALDRRQPDSAVGQRVSDTLRTLRELFVDRDVVEHHRPPKSCSARRHGIWPTWSFRRPKSRLYFSQARQIQK
jgi:hypothetical protein